MSQSAKQIWWECLRKMVKPVERWPWFASSSGRFATVRVNWFSKVPDNDFDKNKGSLEMVSEADNQFVWLVKYP